MPTIHSGGLDIRPSQKLRCP